MPGGRHEQVLCRNIDVAAVVVALHPPPVLSQVERLVALARESHARLLVVLTKADLVHVADLVARDLTAVAAGVEIVPVSVRTGHGVAALRDRLEGRLTLALLGASGHGTSSLTDALVGAEVLATRELRDDGSGRRRSVRRELVPLPGGGAVVDLPGLRVVGPGAATAPVEAWRHDRVGLPPETRGRRLGAGSACRRFVGVPDDAAAEIRGRVRLPASTRSPLWQFVRRIIAALAILGFTVALVYFDRAGYRDNADPTVSRVNLIDAIYYTTVTLSTTGYGDIAPYAAHSRLINAFIVTPLRIAFLVLLIGTTLEVLANQGREMYRISRWRKSMDNHVVVIGYGTKGRSAVETLKSNGVDPDQIVVVDPSSIALGEAHADGLAVVTGDATRREVLRRAGVARAKQVIITTDRDDSTVLATLNVRQLNPDTYVVAAVRESDNVQLVRQSGADSVVTSSDAVGRLLGLSSLSPTLGAVMEDLLSYGEGLEVAERDLLVQEVGRPPQSLPDQVLAVVRDGTVHRYFDPAVTQLVRGDRLVVVRPSTELPWAPRPGTHGEQTTLDEET